MRAQANAENELDMSINSIKPMIARQNTTKKRPYGSFAFSIHSVCEHFELDFDEARAASADL